MSSPGPVRHFFHKIFAVPHPFNWGYSFLFAALGTAVVMLLSKIVFDSGVHIVMATIEACFSGGILLTEQESLKNGGKVSRLVHDILKFYSRYAINNGWDRTAIFDMTTIVYLLAPEIFEYRDMRVDIELDGVYTRGMTVCDDRGPTYIGNPENPKRVLMKADRDRLSELFFATLKHLDETYR